MTILITGASGILGRCLVDLCSRSGINYITTYNTRKIQNSYKINYNDDNDIYKLLKEKEITICINCIVQRQVDICETNWDETKKTNIDIVDNLSRVCEKLEIYLIHISTDYVFDGRNSPYFPNSHTNPLQNYGISKLISEKRIISNSKNYTIIRVPVLYSDNIENLSENAVTIIGKKVLNCVENIDEDDYSIRRPVFIPDLCEFILSFVKTPKIGTFHFYNYKDITTKYNTAKLIGQYLGLSIEHIKPIKYFQNMANRPYDTEMKDNQYDITKYNITTLEDGITKCFQKWKHPLITQSTSEDSIFIMLDLDGTILDTDKIHYKAYMNTFKEYKIDISWKDFEYYINFKSIDLFIEENNLPFEDIKRKKMKYMLESNDIEFIEGAQAIIELLVKNNINFVIVTNTSRIIVDHYIRTLPFLNNIKNWICKEDYNNPKPSNEPYSVAVKKYYKGEKYKIGFENTINGYESIRNEVDHIYFITNKDSITYNKIKKEDIILIPNFLSFR